MVCFTFFVVLKDSEEVDVQLIFTLLDSEIGLAIDWL